MVRRPSLTAVVGCFVAACVFVALASPLQHWRLATVAAGGVGRPLAVARVELDVDPLAHQLLWATSRSDVADLQRGAAGAG